MSLLNSLVQFLLRDIMLSRYMLSPCVHFSDHLL